MSIENRTENESTAQTQAAEMKPSVPGFNQEMIEKYFPDHLEAQLGHLMSLYRGYNEKLPDHIKRPEKDFLFSENFNASFLADRNKRAEEVAQPEYLALVERAQAELPMPTFFVLCMDGRVKVIHTNGFSADMAGALRTPAGLLNEFTRQDAGLKLEDNSNFAKLLLTSTSKSAFVAQVLDSHTGCLARTQEEEATGHKPKDAGLFRDVLHKQEMIGAMRKFLESKSMDSSKAILIQTSFNPVTGYMYMGLETENALQSAKDKASKQAKQAGKDPDKAARHAEYTKETIQELVSEGKIISTGQLISEPEIKQALDNQWFEIDREEKYVESAIKFLDGVISLKKELLPILKEKLLKIYANLDEESEASKKELDERAMLLLTNMYNTYLQNRDHDEVQYSRMTDKAYEEEKHYKYGIHSEEGVKVSEGGHPPYKKPMFVIYSGDLENMPARIERSSKLVRDNRREGRVVDGSGQYTDPNEFAEAIVPVVMQEITRDEEDVTIEEEQWAKLQQADWSDMPKEWNNLDDNGEFGRYLRSKGVKNILLIEGVERLREKMSKIYDPTSETAPHLADLYKTVLPIMCDQHRKTYAIIPFVKVARPSENGNSSN